MGTHKKRNRKPLGNNSRNDDSAAIFIKMLKAVTAGLFALTLMLLLFSFILTKFDVPFSLLNPISMIMISLSCILSGYLASRSVRKRGFAIGAACGVIIDIILILVSFFFSDYFDLQAVLKFIVSVLSGSIGGVLGVNQKAHRRI